MSIFQNITEKLGRCHFNIFFSHRKCFACKSEKMTPPYINAIRRSRHPAVGPAQGKAHNYRTADRDVAGRNEFFHPFALRRSSHRSVPAENPSFLGIRSSYKSGYRFTLKRRSSYESGFVVPTANSAKVCWNVGIAQLDVAETKKHFVETATKSLNHECLRLGRRAS